VSKLSSSTDSAKVYWRRCPYIKKYAYVLVLQIYTCVLRCDRCVDGAGACAHVSSASAGITAGMLELSLVAPAVKCSQKG
jgi:hypothetical protein